jgi:hypothetical protein
MVDAHYVLWGRPSCPLRSEKRQGAGKNRLHNASRASRPTSPLSSPTDYARRSITIASTTNFDGFSSGAGRGRAGAGFDSTILCTLQTATLLRRYHLLHSVGSSQTSGLGQLQGCGARGPGLADSDDTIFCTLRAAVRQPAPACCRASTRVGGLQAPTTPSFALFGPPSGSRLWPVAGLLRGGARLLRRHQPLHSAGSGRLQGCCAWEARRLRRHHLLHSAGRRPAAA